jgi:acetyl esterase/lipase
MNGVSDELARRLRALGSNATASETQALYAPLLARQARTGVLVARDVAYGTHARHRLDVYWPEHSAELSAPVVVLLHGGGFVRGDKSQRASFGYWAARNGFVAMLPNYRLAPESRWPSGPEDVVRIWSWLRENADDYAGDAERIVLMGESAGAAHLAAACLRRELQPAGWHIAAAVLSSGPYNPQLEAQARAQFAIPTPDPRNDAYYGVDSATLAQANNVEHVSVPPFPLLISYAERDLLQMQVQAAEPFVRLVTRHEFAPTLLCVPDHNHYSQAYSFGTSDENASGPVLEFMRQHTRTL